MRRKDYLIMTNKLDKTTIDEIKREYQSSDCPWFIGYSGGKDSSALLSLVFMTLAKLRKCNKPVVIVYSDTGVEIPVVKSFTKNVLRNLITEAKVYNIPITTKIVRPKIDDTFFVKIIGRGYPPPTNKFRWCTDRLRINPLQKFMANIEDDEKIVLLGTRRGESPERDKILSCCQAEKKKFYYQVGHTKTKIYAPIVNYSCKDIWNTLCSKDLPKSLDTNKLLSLYKSATNGDLTELINNRHTGRFGCWTCTVIRKDRAVTNMSNDGFPELAPLLDFRNWLSLIRDNTNFRAKQRRNGQKGLGPFTLKARKNILKELFKVESQTKWQLITKKETEKIYSLWEEDK